MVNPDSKLPNDEQRKKLCELMYWAFLEMRNLGWGGKAKQAADLADAFHNLPTGMWHDDFSFEFFRNAFLVPYQEKYPERRAKDFIAMAK